MLRAAAFLVLTFVIAGNHAGAQVPGLISQPTAERHGLTRGWFAQVDVDRNMGRIDFMTLDHGVIFVHTNQAVVHAINAESG